MLKEDGELKEKIANYKNVNKTLLSAVTALSKSITRPVLTGPTDDEQVIGNQVELSWKTGDRYEGQGYIVELRNVRTSNSWTFNTPIVSPSTSAKQLVTYDYVMRPEQRNSEYLWRVRPGHLESTAGGTIPIAEGGWSPYGHFWVFESIRQRICTSATLLVGIGGTSFGPLSRFDKTGDIVGFDRELMDIIAEGMRVDCHLDNPLRIALREQNRDSLLADVSDGRSDIAISSITATRKREKETHVLFSIGYYPVHETLMARRGGAKIPVPDRKDLEIGVQQGTSNEDAADYLCRDGLNPWGCRVVNTFGSNNELYQALMSKSVDLIMIDDVAVARHFEPDDGTLCQVPVNLDRELREFYKQERPSASIADNNSAEDPSEEYSIAVRDEPTLDRVNEILEENQEKLRQIQRDDVPHPSLAACKWE